MLPSQTVAPEFRKEISSACSIRSIASKPRVTATAAAAAWDCQSHAISRRRMAAWCDCATCRRAGWRQCWCCPGAPETILPGLACAGPFHNDDLRCGCLLPDLHRRAVFRGLVPLAGALDALELADHHAPGRPVAFQHVDLAAAGDELSAELGERRRYELAVFLVTHRVVHVDLRNQVSRHDLVSVKTIPGVRPLGKPGPLAISCV